MPAKIKTLLLDDDQQILLILENLMTIQFPNIQVIGKAKTVKEGIQLIDTLKPDLIFLDIEFPDGDGFTILDAVSYTNFETIFISSHEQFAMKAFEYSALHYLRKPIVPAEVNDALSRFNVSSDEATITTQITKVKDALTDREPKLIIPTTEGLDLIKIKDIKRCEASDVYTIFHMVDGKKYMASKSLNNYEKLLSDMHFFRIHSKHLVNMQFIVQYIKGKGGYVVLEQGDELEVSVRKKMDFMNRLKDYARSLK
ncbi:MAG: LytTR family DNA-binding domain-containing protein [Bacteroidales bacterium]|jgi:two-component system LytT family response regulator|nr:LytTR family DNA-binding domain-containing protein [Bacteroidales bacterium]